MKSNVNLFQRDALNVEAMAFCVDLYIFLSFCRAVVIVCDMDYNEAFRWIPNGWTGQALYCPDTCHPVLGDREGSRESCCACSGRSIIYNVSDITYLGVQVNGLIEGRVSSRASVLVHRSNGLQLFPSNICDFTAIIKIDLSNNLILDISNLQCLVNLTRLDLSKNKISVLRKHSLTKNRNLRFVDLSKNSITYLETGVLGTMSLHQIDLRYNDLISVDVLDIIFERPFCFIDLSNNQIQTITNDHNWKLNTSRVYGPGSIDFSYNKMEKMPDLRRFGFSNIFQLGKLMQFAFDWRHNPIICDCTLAKPLLYFKPLVEIFKRNYFDIECKTPPSFRGVTFPSILSQNRIIEMKCNYTSHPVCPARCSCIIQPSAVSLMHSKITLTLIMNCTNAGLARFPHILPESDEIELYFQGNQISRIPPEHYFHRTTILELSSIPVFDNGALENLTHLKKFSILPEEKLKGIPRKLSFLNPCIFLQTEDFVVNCTCAHQWMHDWLATRGTNKCHTGFQFRCLRKNDTDSLMTVMSHLICNQKENPLHYIISSSGICLLLIFITFGVLLYIWKFEIKVIFQKYKACTRTEQTLVKKCVYISSDERNDDINTWVSNTLAPFLIRNEMSVFIPSRDLPLGSVRSEESAGEIAVSRYFIVLLSINYFDEEWFETRNEWQYIWNNCFSEQKELLIINYDLMKANEIYCRKFRAVMRFGNVVNFDKEEKIFSKILETFT